LQFNKRDLPGISPISMLRQQLAPSNGTPYCEAVATEGMGVISTLKQIVTLVFKRVSAT